MFKAGDEVLCVWPSSKANTTLGKLYKIESFPDKGSLRIFNDRGSLVWLFNSRFVPDTPEGRARIMQKLLEEAE